jgi:hypothetical protein
MKKITLTNILSELLNESKFGNGNYVVYDPSTYEIKNVFDGYGRDITKFLDSNKNLKLINITASKIPGNFEILQKIDSINGTKYAVKPSKPTVGQNCTLTMPYGVSMLKFKGILVSINGNTAKVKYKTGGQELTTDAPLEWIS